MATTGDAALTRDCLPGPSLCQPLPLRGLTQHASQELPTLVRELVVAEIHFLNSVIGLEKKQWKERYWESSTGLQMPRYPRSVGWGLPHTQN